MDIHLEVKEHVKERYGKIARQGGSCCSSGCGCADDALEQSKALGYTLEELRQVPQEAVLGLGCGNPTALPQLREGETVLDLGSGGGLDVFLTARKVGERGRAIGVDMTPEMVQRARSNALRAGFSNVEFRLGDIEHLPVEDASIDVVISNCVINLVPDKLAAYREAYRVLKPGGRILISDLVTAGELPEDVRGSFDAWAGCIAGAMERHAYLETIRQAGFKEVEVVAERAYGEPGMDQRLSGKVISLHVRAYK